MLEALFRFGADPTGRTISDGSAGRKQSGLYRNAFLAQL
jgi:hypothetical protein